MKAEIDDRREYFAKLNPLDRFVLDIFQGLERKYHVRFDNEMLAALIAGIPDEHKTLGVLTLGFETAVRTPINGPQGPWGETQLALADRIMQSREPEFVILFPFVVAHEFDEAGIAKYRGGLRPEKYWCVNSSFPPDRVAQAWDKLVSLGILQPVSDPGENFVHWELDPVFFRAIKNPNSLLSFSYEDLEYAQQIFSQPHPESI